MSAAHANERRELIGQILGGKYRVERVLGKGGMGIVVRAHHIKLDEAVAIKILRKDVVEVQGMEMRFLREARAASRIKSEHVAHVTDVDTLEDGTPYMVMEYLEGIDFSDLRKERGTFEIGEAIGYLLQACEAVAEAHSLGIVHRDLKPSNLFLARRRDGRQAVKVLDFGISKLSSDPEGDTTATGTMLGSPQVHVPRADVVDEQRRRTKRYLVPRNNPLRVPHGPHSLRRRNHAADLRAGPVGRSTPPRNLRPESLKR